MALDNQSPKADLTFEESNDRILSMGEEEIDQSGTEHKKANQQNLGDSILTIEHLKDGCRNKLHECKEAYPYRRVFQHLDLRLGIIFLTEYIHRMDMGMFQTSNLRLSQSCHKQRAASHGIFPNCIYSSTSKLAACRYCRCKRFHFSLLQPSTKPKVTADFHCLNAPPRTTPFGFVCRRGKLTAMMLYYCR